MSDYQVHTQDTWEYWLSRPAWTPRQAAWLLTGLYPLDTDSQAHKATVDRLTPVVNDLIQQIELAAKVGEFPAVCPPDTPKVNQFKAGKLALIAIGGPPAIIQTEAMFKPADFTQWAVRAGYDAPKEMRGFAQQNAQDVPGAPVDSGDKYTLKQSEAAEMLIDLTKLYFDDPLTKGLAKSRINHAVDNGTIRRVGTGRDSRYSLQDIHHLAKQIERAFYAKDADGNARF